MDKTLLRLLEEAAIDRELLARIVDQHGLGDRLKKLSESFHEA